MQASLRSLEQYPNHFSVVYFNVFSSNVLLQIFFNMHVIVHDVVVRILDVSTLVFIMLRGGGFYLGSIGAFFLCLYCLLSYAICWLKIDILYYMGAQNIHHRHVCIYKVSHFYHFFPRDDIISGILDCSRNSNIYIVFFSYFCSRNSNKHSFVYNVGVHYIWPVNKCILFMIYYSLLAFMNF